MPTGYIMPSNLTSRMGIFLVPAISSRATAETSLSTRSGSVSSTLSRGARMSNMPFEQLPFADKEFDLVTATEVLEHIPLPDFGKALAEIARVAKDAIIVSVPFDQDLEANLSKCPYCMARFNADFHVRSFNATTLQHIFD